jgi:hypothetical protein
MKANRKLISQRIQVVGHIAELPEQPMREFNLRLER